MTFHPTLASTLSETLLWLVLGLVWLAIQVMQRSQQKNKKPDLNQHPTATIPQPPDQPGDLEDFLAGLFQQSLPEEEPAEAAAEALPAIPVAVTEPPRQYVPRIATRERTPMPALSEQDVAILPPADITFGAFEVGAAMRNIVLLPMPPMQPRVAAQRSIHPLVSALKTQRGIRRVVLCREVIGQPRAFQL